MNFKHLTVSVIGQGYVGLPCALLIANAGFKTIGIETNPKKISTISSSISTIDEPDIQSLLDKNLGKNYFISNQCQKSDIFILCVPTPEGNDGADLSFLESAIKSIAHIIDPGNYVIIESTSPVGTTERISDLLFELRPDLKDLIEERIVFAYCPERVLPGDSINELLYNPRIIGGLRENDSELVEEFYKSFLKCEIFTTNARTAELAKLSENAFRDVNIALANELSMICNDLNIDAMELIELTNKHPRVNILDPGIGVGGHCIPIDPTFLEIPTYLSHSVFKSSRYVNTYKEEFTLKKIINRINKIEDKFTRLIIMGLSYKPNSDDVRSSPALRIATELVKCFKGMDIILHDECLKSNPIQDNKNFTFLNEDINFIEGDKIVILVNHSGYSSLSSEQSDKIIFEPI